MRPNLILTFLALLLFTQISLVNARQPNLPTYAARGYYPVGTREFAIADLSRPLKVTVWYPALNPDHAAETITYALNPLVTIPGHALKDAQPNRQDAPYPLIMFSHGSGASRFLSLYLVEHLASYGFVVMAADHPGNIILDSLQTERFKEAIVPSFAYRPLDVWHQIAFAETLTATGGALEGVINVDHIAVTGHSFGGYTALAAGGARLDFAALNAWCDDPANAALDLHHDTPMYPSPIAPDVTYGSCFMRDQAAAIAQMRGLTETPTGLFPATTDPRIQAVVALAPWNAPIFGADGLAAVTVPTLVMVGSVDHVTPPERDTYAVYQHIGSHPKALVTFQDADHFIFLDECSDFLKTFNFQWACTDPVWDMRYAHEIINHFTTAFLLAALKQDAAAQYALAPDAVNFKGIDYSWAN